MPVILEDDMLIPPSLRRKRYIESDRSIDVSNGSVIDLPPHEPRIEYTGNSEPVIIHQDHYINQRPTEIIREREIIMDPSLGSNVGRRYRVDELDIVQYSRRGRARSVGYDGYTDSSSYGDETDVYYLEDGSRHRRSRRGHGGGGLLAGGGALAAGRHHRHHSPQRVYAHDGHQNHHNGRHLAEGALGGALVRGLRRRSSSPSSDSSDSSDGRGSHHHRLRHVAEAGGAKALYDHHRAHRDSRVYHHEDHDPHRHARHLAEAGLGIAAAGAAKELYDHHRRTRSRSSSSSRSRSRSQSRSHAGRHVAAAALGATAAGLAAHKFRHRRDSYSSYSSDDGEHHHRGRKVAAGVAGATAAGLAAKHFHDRRHRSRSSSTSSTSSTSSNRSSHNRSSHNRSSHKLRNAALGVGAATLAAHHHHKKEQERRSRSQSRPGILRHRSRSYSAPRHRSPSHGPGLAKVAAAATMAGALAEHYKKHRARSADAGGRRRHQHLLGEKRVHYHNNPRAYERSIHPDSSVSNRPRSRRGSMSGGVGSMIKNAIMPSSDHHTQNGIRQRSRSRSRGSGLAQNVAYRIGEGMAEEMAYRVGEETVGGLRRHSRHR